jgi:hypothetical protein
VVRRARVFPFLLLFLAVGRLPAAAPGDFPGTDDKWQHFQTPHFELYSRIREPSARALLHNLELLRSMFLEYFKLTERRRLEVTIYAFKSQKDFQTYGREAYGAKHSFEGFYVHGIDRAVIYLVEGEDAESTRRLIFHEYVHHLFAAAEQRPPSWLNEGMAELFSTIAPVAGKLEFGHPVAGRLWQLQQEKLMPLEQLFAVDQRSPIFRQGQHSGLFYSESWALLHYLHFGESKIDPERRRVFLSLVLKNAFRDAAHLRAGFKELLGMDYSDMEARLKAYVTSGKYFWAKHPMPVVAAASTYPMRAVPETEIRLRLAELALRVSRAPQAKLMLLQAVERNPVDIRVLEALGAEALRDEDELRARERWGQAVELGTRNAAIYRELGLMEGRAVFSQFDVYYRVPEEKARRMREYLLRSIEYNPEQTAAYEMLAWVEAFAAEPSIKNLNTVQRAYPKLARQERTALALAFVRVRLGQKEEALEMLAGLETMQPDEADLYGIEAIRAHIEGRPIRHESARRLSTEEAARVRTPVPKITRPRPAGDR